MPALPSPNLPRIQVKYPTVGLDTQWGTQVQIPLKRTQGVMDYTLNVVLGTPTGGSSPAFAVTKTQPVIQHITVQADNTTVFDVDTPLWDEWNYLTTKGADAGDGLHHTVQMADRHARHGEPFQITLLPTWKFNQVTMIVTLAPFASITTGGATASTGSLLYVTEHAIPRAAINFTPHLVKKLMITTSVANGGDNDLTTFLSQTGAYKALLLFMTTTNPVIGQASFNTGYAGGTNTASDYQQVKLNDLVLDKDTYTVSARSALQALFSVAPDTGYAGFVWMDDDEITKMLNLANTKLVTAVDLNIHQPAAATTYIRALKLEYL